MAVLFVWDYIIHAVQRFGIYYFPDIMDMQFMIRREDDCSCIECGNSLGVRIPSDLVEATGISEGDKSEMTERSDGSIVLQEKKKSVSQLKGFGALHRFADPDLIPLENQAFGMAMEEKDFATFDKKLQSRKKNLSSQQRSVRHNL